MSGSADTVPGKASDVVDGRRLPWGLIAILVLAAVLRLSRLELVPMTNEMAGSDGDIFSHGFKMRGMGPLIGQRTWGGVVGIWPRMRHVDGSLTTQPEFACWFLDVGFGIENHGADPDIEVDISPEDFAQGRDPQLEKAVEVLLQRMEGWSIPRPPDT